MMERILKTKRSKSRRWKVKMKKTTMKRKEEDEEGEEENPDQIPLDRDPNITEEVKEEEKARRR
jgi:hypothetical protein